MTAIESTVDSEKLTLTFVAEFDATIERVWQLWVDPRQVERWWGPPTWPATFITLDPVVGGDASYYMTSPEGEKAYGWWRFTALTPPRALEIDDGFSHDDAEPDESMPTIHMSVWFDDISDVSNDGAGGATKTRMTTVTSYQTREEFEKVLAMGMREGMIGAQGQIEAILAG
jgi:uncharacterized protein YndB with AHSA1/START domain